MIRNFCIIAHIDHGKSTLADRMLQLTGVVDARNARAQYLDRMDIERERGITIKSQAVRMPWTADGGPDAGKTFVLNMIDTPGHVDFTYEVSRSLEACEGAVLLVDAAQGIEAQTLANLYLALEADLDVIPVLNKIDLPSAQPEKYAAELAHIIGCDPDDVLRVSAKTGEGVDRAPRRDRRDRAGADRRSSTRRPRALIFDSVYDTYRGVDHVRPGRSTASCSHRDRIKMMSTGAVHEMLEVGVISPEPNKAAEIGVGEVGYLITGVKEVRQSRVGDTVTSAVQRATEALGGYRHPNPMVYAGLYPMDGDDYPTLRDALDKLQLNDAALVYEPETSSALGLRLPLRLPRPAAHGDRAGAARARVQPRPHLHAAQRGLPRADGGRRRGHRHQPERVPRRRQDRRGARAGRQGDDPRARPTSSARSWTSARTAAAPSQGMDYLSEDRVEMRYTLPLAEIVFDFFDALKSRTKGYASLDYEPIGEQASDLVKVDVLLHGDPVDAFSAIVHRDAAYAYGVQLAQKLKELIPRQQFEVPIQAAIGARVIARETIRAMRKDVLAKCYGGDITRKRKLLEKQKEGKKRMKMVGRVEVPQEAFIAALNTSEPSRRPRSSSAGLRVPSGLLAYQGPRRGVVPLARPVCRDSSTTCSTSGS